MLEFTSINVVGLLFSACIFYQEQDTKMGVLLRVLQNLRKTFFRTAPRDCFCNFYVVKVQHLIHCTLFTKLRYFSNSLQISVSLTSLESYYQVENNFILFSKNKKVMFYEMAMTFINIFYKMVTIRTFNKLDFFLFMNLKLLF